MSGRHGPGRKDSNVPRSVRMAEQGGGAPSSGVQRSPIDVRSEGRARDGRPISVSERGEAYVQDGRVGCWLPWPQPSGIPVWRQAPEAQTPAGGSPLQLREAVQKTGLRQSLYARPRGDGPSVSGGQLGRPRVRVSIGGERHDGERRGVDRVSDRGQCQRDGMRDRAKA